MSRLFINRYLPEGVDYDSLSQEDIVSLVEIYSQCEEKREAYFREIVKKAFTDYFNRRSEQMVQEYLPQKPRKVRLDELDPETARKVVESVKEGLAAGVTKKTLRKRVRKLIG